ncbi:hypothetical protein [Streptomyces flaveolus]|uniref:hypothetical protein n=1 Tax=Streptomyces flaveolus TaxID=67297 RepID=UPI003331C59E
MNGWQRDGSEPEPEPESRAGTQAEPEAGSGHGPSEERGRAAWSPDGPDGADGPVEPPAWASAQTRTSLTPPPGLPSAAPPPQWTPAPTPPPGTPDAGGATPTAPDAADPTPAGPAPVAPWAPNSAAPVPAASWAPAPAGPPPAGPWVPDPAGPPPAAPGAPPSPWTYGPQPASTAPPYQPPPPGPGAGSGPGLRRVLVALTATAVLGAGVGAGVWALTRDDGADRAGGTPATGVTVTNAPTAPASDTAPASAAPAASPATSATASVSPSAAPGYRHAQDPVGYAITVPEGWRRHEKQGESAAVVTYDSPDGGRQLQIFALVEETPAASLDLAENATGYGFARQPGYRALTRSSGGDAFSELVYRYEDEHRGPRQVIDHRFRAADGTLYAIRSSGPETLDGALLREPLTTAVDSFCPAGGECA